MLDAECAAGRRRRASASTTRSCRATSRAGAVLLLDDGLHPLDVERVDGPRIVTRVECYGGVLSNNKGINRQGGGLTAPALTPKDMDDIKTAAQIEGRLPRGVVPEEQADMYMARAAAARRRRPARC